MCVCCVHALFGGGLYGKNKRKKYKYYQKYQRVRVYMNIICRLHELAYMFGQIWSIVYRKRKLYHCSFFVRLLSKYVWREKYINFCAIGHYYIFGKRSDIFWLGKRYKLINILPEICLIYRRVVTCAEIRLNDMI